MSADTTGDAVAVEECDGDAVTGDTAGAAPVAAPSTAPAAAPYAKDADELVRQEGGAARLRAMIDSAEDGWSVMVARRFGLVHTKIDAGSAVAELLPFVAAQKSAVTREGMLEDISRHARVSVKYLRMELKRIDTGGMDGSKDERLALEVAEAFVRAMWPGATPAQATPSEPADAPHPDRKETRFSDPLPRSLVYYRDGFYRYTGAGYDAVADGEMTAEVIRFIQQNSIGKPSMSFTSNVLHNLKGLAKASYSLDMPSWLDGRGTAGFTLSLANGILDVRKVVGEGAVLEPHTPDLFTVTPLPYRYDHTANCPRWDTFLAEIIPDETDRATLMEWMGYCLIPTQRFQKMLLMTGSGANGKSIVCSVLSALVGEKNCGSQPLENIHEGHNLKPLEGKLVNFSPELSRLCPGAEGVVKGITGGDTLTINPKNKDQHEAKIYARLTITSNNMPTVADRTDAFFRRMLILPFPVQIAEERQRNPEELIASLVAELPGILNRALESLKNLMARGRFIETTAGRDFKSDLKIRSNTALAFLEELYAPTRKLHYTVSKKVLYKEYADWCEEQGFKHSFSAPEFGRILADWVVKQLPDITREDVLGHRARKEDGVAHVYRHVVASIRHGDDVVD